MITRRHLVGLAAASALAPAASPRIARAQQPLWPNRIVKLVAPFPPGGGTDVVARILTNRLSEVWGQQVVVENKPGAGGNFGAEQVARADPDGYTILIAALPMAVNRFLFKSLGYDSITDFAPVIMICQFPNLLVVPNSSPAKTVQELIAHGKANSGKLTFASSGVGTSPHLSGELFKRMAGFEMTHIPYRGVAPALSDVIPGRVDMMFNTAAGVLQQAAFRPGARARGQHREAVSDRDGISDRRGIRPARLRRHLLVRAVRAGRRRPPTSSRRSTPIPWPSWPSPRSRRGSSRSASRWWRRRRSSSARG